jgi:DNA-binding CsgD family transcriptional regulator
MPPKDAPQPSQRQTTFPYSPTEIAQSTVFLGAMRNDLVLLSKDIGPVSPMYKAMQEWTKHEPPLMSLIRSTNEPLLSYARLGLASYSVANMIAGVGVGIGQATGTLLANIGDMAATFQRLQLEHFNSIQILRSNLVTLTTGLADMLRYADSLFGPDSLWGRMELARNGDPESLHWLAMRITVSPYDPKAHRELVLQAADRGYETVLIEARMAAIYEVLASREDERVQSIRWGRHGRSFLAVPDELPPRDYLRWFKQAVRNGMEKYFTGDDPEKPSRRIELLPLESWQSHPDDDLTPEELAIVLESEEDARQAFERLLALATPRQRDILHLALQHGPNWSQVGRILGLDRRTVDSHKRRLKASARQLQHIWPM